MLPVIAGYDVYLVCLGFSVLVGSIIFITGLRSAYPSYRGALVLLGLLCFAGIGGAKLYSLWVRGFPAFEIVAELRGGLRYPGALIGVALALFFWSRWSAERPSLLAICDCTAPALAFAMATFRVGCLATGCCFGSMTEKILSIQFPVGSPAWHAHLESGWIRSLEPTSAAVHPLQVYFIVLSLAVGTILLGIQRIKQFDGQVVLAYLAIHEPLKWGLEFLRAEEVGHIQAVSGLVAVAAWGLVALLFFMRRKVFFQTISDRVHRRGTPDRAAR